MGNVPGLCWPRYENLLTAMKFWSPRSWMQGISEYPSGADAYSYSASAKSSFFGVPDRLAGLPAASVCSLAGSSVATRGTADMVMSTDVSTRTDRADDNDRLYQPLERTFRAPDRAPQYHPASGGTVPDLLRWFRVQGRTHGRRSADRQCGSRAIGRDAVTCRCRRPVRFPRRIRTGETFHGRDSLLSRAGTDSRPPGTGTDRGLSHGRLGVVEERLRRDAYARTVALNIHDGEPPIATITDDGHGMSRDDFIHRWLEAGTESKAGDSQVSDRDRNGLPPRARQGQKA